VGKLFSSPYAKQYEGEKGKEERQVLALPKTRCLTSPPAKKELFDSWRKKRGSFETAGELFSMKPRGCVSYL